MLVNFFLYLLRSIWWQKVNVKLIGIPPPPSQTLPGVVTGYVVKVGEFCCPDFFSILSISAVCEKLHCYDRAVLYPVTLSLLIPIPMMIVFVTCLENLVQQSALSQHSATCILYCDTVYCSWKKSNKVFILNRSKIATFQILAHINFTIHVIKLKTIIRAFIKTV